MVKKQGVYEMKEKWYSKLYRRHLLDMHIEDWSDEFLSEFDEEKYFENLKIAKIQSPMIYLQSHVGLCNFPTKVAKAHKTLGDGKRLQRLIDKCVAEGMKVVGYYSLVYNVWAEVNHPEWAMRSHEGKTSIDYAQRYGLCCPNNVGYREFLRAQMKEMSAIKGLSGIFHDMPFWPMPCQCDACKKRWAEEVGGEMPETVDFSDERFLTLVRKRQVWMGEFVQYVKEITLEYFPAVTVEFNYAGVLAFGWMEGETELINDACEFSGGDLYGDLYDHTFSAKYYASVTKNQPFEYMVCRCDKRLQEHTITKTDGLLATELRLTSAHHGANFVIDAIDPKGSMDRRVYEKLGRLFGELIPYEEYYYGEPIADVGVFYDTKAQFSVGKGFEGCNKFCSINATRTFVENHIPVSVLANGVLDKMQGRKLVVAGELEDFYADYVPALIEYVKEGGRLYLSGKSNQTLMKEFFGVAFDGFTKEIKTYVRPTEDFVPLFGEFTEEYPMPIDARLPRYSGAKASTVKGYITLPYTDPADNRKFASIHSNPPGIKTELPAILKASYGKGEALWSAAAIELERREGFKKVFLNIVNDLVGNGAWTVKTNLSRSVETVLHASEKGILIYFVDVVNYEESLRLPYDVEIACETRPTKVVVRPSGEELPFTYANGKVSFHGEVTNFLLVEILY